MDDVVQMLPADSALVGEPGLLEAGLADSSLEGRLDAGKGVRHLVFDKLYPTAGPLSRRFVQDILQAQMLDATPFVEKVKQLRAAKGWTGETLAHKASDPDVEGQRPGTVRAAMDGKRPPSIQVMAAIAEALDVPPGDFAESRAEREPTPPTTSARGRQRLERNGRLYDERAAQWRPARGELPRLA